MDQAHSSNRQMSDHEYHEIHSRADLLHFCREAPPDVRYAYVVKIIIRNAVVDGVLGRWLTHDLKIVHNSLLPGMLMRAMVLLTKWAAEVKRTRLMAKALDLVPVQKTVSIDVRAILSDHERALLGPEFPQETEFRILKDQLDKDGVLFAVYRRPVDERESPRQVNLPDVVM